jgi:superoxide dismutase, Cu-Zn family
MMPLPIAKTRSLTMTNFPRNVRAALAVTLAASSLAACALTAPPSMAQAATEGSAPTVAAMRTADGTDVGTISFQQAEHGVIFSVAVRGLPSGAHGMHIHQTGACTPTFDAAGGHFNPAATEHGFHSAAGYHAGDLPNLDIAADGTGKAEFFVPNLSLTDQVGERRPHTLADADGAAIIIHAATDDYRTMASSGGRLACGVIVPAGG